MSSLPEITTAYLALGGNVGDVEKTFSGVCRELSNHESAGKIRYSRLYKTAPWGVTDQNDFFNLVVEIQWAGTLEQLSGYCFLLEDRYGRDRKNEIRWGPRPIDIDLLLYGDFISKETSLEIPHPRMHLRRFVLKPLSDLVQETMIPAVNLTIQDALAACEDDGEVNVVNEGLWKPI